MAFLHPLEFLLSLNIFRWLHYSHIVQHIPVLQLVRINGVVDVNNPSHIDLRMEKHKLQGVNYPVLWQFPDVWKFWAI